MPKVLHFILFYPLSFQFFVTLNSWRKTTKNENSSTWKTLLELSKTLSHSWIFLYSNLLTSHILKIQYVYFVSTKYVFKKVLYTETKVTINSSRRAVHKYNSCKSHLNIYIASGFRKSLTANQKPQVQDRSPYSPEKVRRHYRCL